MSSSPPPSVVAATPSSSFESNPSFGYRTPIAAVTASTPLRNTEVNSEARAYGNHGLSSPPKGPACVPFSVAKQRIMTDGLWDKYESDNDTLQLILFMYCRGFMADAESKTRKETVKTMIGKQGPRERLRRLLNADGDLDLSHIPKINMIYEKNLKTLELYFQQHGAVGFLDDMDKAQYFFRFQKSGNCYLQAPCVMMSYLSQKHGFKIVDPVDLSKLVRHTFDDSELNEYVVKDSGGDSKVMLSRLLELYGESEVVFTGMEANAGPLGGGDLLLRMFKMYGPALVSNFHVHKNFGGDRLPDVSDDECGYFRYSGANQCRGTFVRLSGDGATTEASFSNSDDEGVEVSPEGHPYWSGSTSDAAKTPVTTETHAMLLIGIRIDEQNRRWCLLQNWWESLQLVEVSLEYLGNCKSNFSFYVSQKGFDCNGGTVSRSHAIVAECNSLDRCEEKALNKERSEGTARFF